MGIKLTCSFSCSGSSAYDIPNTINVAQLFEATPKLSIVMRRPHLFVGMGFTANFASDEYVVD